MIPVMTRTKTDKSAIDLAGVEAGEKIFVPFGDEPFGSIAHDAAADHNGRTIVCARHRKVEDFICDIDISLLLFFTSDLHFYSSLLLFTSEMRADLAISPRFLLLSRAAVPTRAFD